MKIKHKKIISLLLGFVLAVSFSACGSQKNSSESSEGSLEEIVRVEDTRTLNDFEYTRLNLSGVDDLGRVFLPSDEENKELYVGMFFFLTLGAHADHTGIYDVNKITNGGKNLDNFYYTDDASSPVGAAHFWGEPVWGYYQSNDEWVIRRQIEMLTMAGIDFLVFDTTNGVLYDDTVALILQILEEYRSQGWNVPQFMYYIATNDKECIEHVYDLYYKDGKYKELWFAPEGKPMITQMYSTMWDETDERESAIEDTFDIRYRQWPTESFLRLGLPWVEFSYPQPIHTDFISVSCAQHTATKFSETTDNRGKGYDYSRMVNDSSMVAEGPNYQAQWDRAISGEHSEMIKYVLCTQWNEWVATKFLDNDGKAFMVDNFNAEYSRDMEPCYDGFGDNYYMQTIENLRRFKYSEGVHYLHDLHTIDISDFGEAQWSEVENSYRDFTGEAVKRDHAAFDSSFNYVNDTNRNDIESISVCHDDTYAYFRITTLKNITSYVSGDQGWMNVYIGTDSGTDNLFGYEYVLNKSVEGNKTSLCRRVSGKWEKISDGDIYVNENVMQIRVKLSDLGLNQENYTFTFKVTDNVGKEEDILSYYNSGDAAPIGRLSYTYGY